MRYFLRKFIGLILILVLCFSLTACGGTKDTGSDPVEEPPVEDVFDRELIYGIGEPLSNSNVAQFNYEKTVDLVGALGAKSYRMWLTATGMYGGWRWDTVMDNEKLGQLDEMVIARYNEIFDSLKRAGVEEITAMGHFLPRVPSTCDGNQDSVPIYGSADYQLFLEKIEIIWHAMAKAFPQITVWEVGNETNHLPFMCYNSGGYNADNTPYTELIKVTTDLCYYARRGIKRANPDAIVITPGFAPTTTIKDDNGKSVRYDNGIDVVAYAMELMYENIASGSFPYGLEADTEPDNYFDGVAYHPYDLGSAGKANTNDPNPETFDIRLWIEANNRVYDVLCKNGDSEKEFWFTEFGLSSKQASLVETDEADTDINVYYVGDSYYKTTEAYEQQQAAFVEVYFDAMESDEMHYVHACHFFRMYGCTIDYSWNGFTVLYYGMFLEPYQTLNRGFYPRAKAYKIQEIYGGTGDLMKYSKWEDVE